MCSASLQGQPKPGGQFFEYLEHQRLSGVAHILLDDLQRSQISRVRCTSWERLSMGRMTSCRHLRSKSKNEDLRVMHEIV